MHEASLMRDLVKQITVLAEEQNAQRITRVSIWLGALSHMSKEHFREHFEQATDGCIAQNAELDIQLSDDINDPNAQDLLLKSIQVETED